MNLDGNMTHVHASDTNFMFARRGIPEIVVTDNGPQYSSQTCNAYTGAYGLTQVCCETIKSSTMLGRRSMPLNCSLNNGDSVFKWVIPTVHHVMEGVE